MSRRTHKRINKKYPGLGSSRFLIITGALVFIFVVAGVAVLRTWYSNNLSPVSSDTKTVYFTVEQGETKHEIAVGLEEAHLIKSSKAFETYLRSNEIDILQAGTYTLSPSMSVAQITEKMVKGDVTKNLLTILPGKSLSQIKEAFLKAGYSQSEIDAAFSPSAYSGHPVVAADLLGNATLDGFLYPDSFQKDSNTPASAIIRESLDEMQSKLTPDVIAGFSAQGLNVYQGVTLASIVEREVPVDRDRPIVAQIFLSRLRQGINLESDATTDVYNTYENGGLPPRPISNVTSSSLNAVAKPAGTDYLYFVSGDDGVTHFSKTKADHDAAIKQYCQKKCVQP
jgi:UPF0755 protein